MAGIPDEKLQELRDRIDIVDLIGRYVGLTRSGKNHKACCPFHREKTPSFYVNPERRSYKCFGCGVYGDGLQFVMEIEGLGFLEAAEKLAELYGVTLRRSAPGPRGEQDAEQLARARKHEADRKARAILQLAAALYRDLLLRAPEGEAARAYQADRKITAAASETFSLGYAPAPSEGGWDTLARALVNAGHSLEIAEELGLVGRSQRTGAPFDKFRGRLMFPIIRPGGTVIGFSGRILPVHNSDEDGREAPKYLNSPESSLFKKSAHLFGLHAASQAIRERRRAILVEGNIDVVTMHQRGHEETIAPLGTALTAAQVDGLARFTKTVVLCFDGDGAGRKAARAAVPLLLEAELDARMVALSPNEDPDSADPERLDNLLEQPRSAFEWMLERMVAQGATESIDAQARALGAIAPLLRRVKASVQDLYVDRTAKMLNLSPGRVSALLRENRGPSSGPREAPRSPPVPDTAPMRPLPELPREQATLATLLVDNPHLATLAEREGVLEHITDERLAPIVRAVLAAAREGEQPGEGELLELIDRRAHRQVHEVVFAGTFRDTPQDPGEILTHCLDDCRRKALERRRKAHRVEQRRALEEGDHDRARQLAHRLVELGRELADLGRASPTIRRGQA
ncbi:MAG: DNA primase [Nannocystaceae bacterium]|nr:DNA primase [Myxococcales bacterium]